MRVLFVVRRLGAVRDLRLSAKFVDPLTFIWSVQNVGNLDEVLAAKPDFNGVACGEGARDGKLFRAPYDVGWSRFLNFHRQAHP